MLKRVSKDFGHNEPETQSLRAVHTTFSLEFVNETERRILVTEMMPRLGHKAALIGPAFRDLRNTDEALAFADALIGYCVAQGWVPASLLAAKKVLFALEVVRRLSPEFRVTALVVSLWARRDISGDDLIREANPK